jgi:hypothetical protein
MLATIALRRKVKFVKFNFVLIAHVFSLTLDYSQDAIARTQRPNVDSLLDELNNARSISPVYALPHDEVKIIN